MDLDRKINNVSSTNNKILNKINNDKFSFLNNINLKPSF
jgi:hypothetical protein